MYRICTVGNLFAVQVGARTHAKLSHYPFIYNNIDYNIRIINILLDVLVCSIAVYIFARCLYRARQNSQFTKQEVLIMKIA